MAIKRPSPTRPALDFGGIFKGSLIALAVALAGSFFLGLIYHFTGLREASLPVSSSVILLFGVFCGGYSAARRSGSRGLFHGVGVGLVIFILIWLLMAFFLPAGAAFFPVVQKLLVCLAGGALGGVVAVARS